LNWSGSVSPAGAGERAAAGGKIETDRRDGYICERGPASYLDRQNSITPLARGLGIEGRVLRPLLLASAGWW